MPQITYIEHDGVEHVLEVDSDTSVMHAARDYGIPGIDGDCGGVSACATCHVLIAPEWLSRLDPPSEQELDLLDPIPDRDETSRLSCQIRLSDQLDGIVVRLPQSQH